jgi:DNA repair protein RecN (Recombination protein N)
MIEKLLIQNLILVEKAQIQFGPGLNIMTGETGAGKSAILAAIRLILGERADAQLIRTGADLAIVEATVRLSNSPVTLRRELHRSGRSRYFIEESLTSLAEVKQFLGRSIELVDQSTSHKLSETEEQRYLLDSFAAILPLVDRFAAQYKEQLQAEKRLEELFQLQQTSAANQARMTEDLTLIEEVNWRSGEEESLTAEHTLLTHSQELLEKISATTLYLLESSQPVIPTLKRFSNQLEQLVEIAPKMEEAVQLFKNSLLEMEEAARLLLSYADRLDADPNRLDVVEKRIGEIESLKKRFGPFEKIELLKKELSTQIDRIANLDTDIEEARTALATLQAQNLLAANKMTQAREKGAIALGNAVMTELKHLNLPHARFAALLEPKPLAADGANAIRFLFAANPGQSLLPLDQCASGGELSRLLFAIKTALAEKEQSSTLILDEIDSNVGGQTAAILGAKLQTLAASRQLICVTHFVQVARCAMHHFLVAKQTTPSGALTTISKLGSKQREEEFSRMTGGV